MRQILFWLTFIISLPILAQEPTKYPAPIIVCPAGQCDQHHHTPTDEWIKELMTNEAKSNSESSCSTIEVTYIGFSAQAQETFQAAVDIWEAVLSSPVTIKVEANWTDLGDNVLGSAGSNFLFRSFPNAPDNRFYSASLADQIAGADQNPGEPDIIANFNSEFDWYFGTDGNTPFEQYDLVSVVLHEIGHGLGFSSSKNYDEVTGEGSLGLTSELIPTKFDDFLTLGPDGVNLVSFPPGIPLGSALVGDNVFNNSPQAISALGDEPQIYAPENYAGGSSISHWDEIAFPPGDLQSLMTPQIGNGEAIHNPGTITLGLFEDMGWTLCESVIDLPCETWVDPSPTTGWNDFNDIFEGAPCDDGSGCPFNEIQNFEVFASEAYVVSNFIAGGEYTFSMCNGPGAGSWIPEFTIIAPSGAIDAFGLGDGDGCSITWTASEEGTYFIVINEVGNCGVANAIGNGYPALTCSDGTADCSDEEPCSISPLVLEGPDSICPEETTTVDINTAAEVPEGGGVGILFESLAGNGNVELSSASLPYTFDNDLNGLLTANDIDLFEGTYDLTVFVYVDEIDVAGSICATASESVQVTFLAASDAPCLVITDPCETWVDPSPTTGFNDFITFFEGAPCDDGSGCPFNEIQNFEVFASEAYVVSNFIAGGEYTFSMCNGPGAGSWIPEFTIIAPSGAIDAFGLGDGDGCSITWTASEEGTYFIVINEAGNCGVANAIGNGYPALTCSDGTADCSDEEPCSISPLVLEGPDSICPEETTTVDINTAAEVPEGGGVGILFESLAGNGNVEVSSVSPPYTFDNDLNGLLTANDIDLFEGLYNLTVFVYTDGNDVAGTTCATASESVQVTFLTESDAPCIEITEPCETWVDPSPTTGFNDFITFFDGAPCDDGSGCPFNEIQNFEVFASEAYVVTNFIAGGEYTFSMCNGPGAGSWIPDFTIIAPSGAIDAFGLGDGDGCSITWTASEDGIYLIVINEAGNCGVANAIGNGYPALTCSDGNPECIPDEPCSIETLEIDGQSSICPDDSTTVFVPLQEEIPSAGGMAIEFYSPALDDGIVLFDTELPYTFNNDLNGVLSSNDMDPLQGPYELTSIVYSDATDPEGSICATAENPVIVNFLEASDPLCLLGINENDNQVEWNVYPNPAENELNLIVSSPFHSDLILNVYDLSGRQVLNRTISKALANGRVQLDIAHLNQGVYQVIVATDEFVGVKSLIVSR